MTGVMAVVPTYLPDATLPGRVELLRAQVDKVIVVDDGSGLAANDVLLLAERAGAEIIRVGSNRGIAHALNTGTAAAIAHGARFIVTVDQDSELPPTYIQLALELFARSDRVLNLGMAVVGSVNGEAQIPRWISPQGVPLAEESIQSGFVVSAECVTVCGMYDEELFIDCVDTEFCLRVREHGYRIGLILDGDMSHAIGRQEPLRPFGHAKIDASGAPITYQYHAPFRRYYIARNNIDLVKRYWKSDRGWCESVLWRERIGMYRAITSGPSRAKHLLAITVGTLHGLTRRRGRIPAWLERSVSPRPQRGA